MREPGGVHDAAEARPDDLVEESEFDVDTDSEPDADAEPDTDSEPDPLDPSPREIYERLSEDVWAAE